MGEKVDIDDLVAKLAVRLTEKEESHKDIEVIKGMIHKLSEDYSVRHAEVKGELKNLMNTVLTQNSRIGKNEDALTALKEKHITCQAPMLTVQNKSEIDKLTTKVEKIESETDIVRFNKKYPAQQRYTVIGIIVVGIISLLPVIKFIADYFK